MNFFDKAEALSLETDLPVQLERLISVEADEHSVRIRTTARAGLRWNQRFAWRDIAAACRVHSGDGSQADLLFLDLYDRPEPGRLPMRAPGAEDFYRRLIGRGITPVHSGDRETV